MRNDERQLRITAVKRRQTLRITVERRRVRNVRPRMGQHRKIQLYALLPYRKKTLFAKVKTLILRMNLYTV